VCSKIIVATLSKHALLRARPEHVLGAEMEKRKREKRYEKKEIERTS